MPIQNYQNPGVYVTQVGNPALAGANNNNLNICILANVPSGQQPTASMTDRFLVTSFTASGTLTVSGVVPSSLVLSNNTTGTILTTGTDYTTITGSTGTITGFTLISGTNVSALQSSYVKAVYNYTTAVKGTFYTFYDYDSLQNTFGPAFSFADNTGVATVSSPASLAGYLAFQNGAQSVTCTNIIRSGNTATSAEWVTAIQSLVNVPDIDVIVPLVTDSGLTSSVASGTIWPQLNNFLNAQAGNGIYQRAFIGLSGNTTNNTIFNEVSNVVTGLNSTRITLTAPQTVNVNPGLNNVTGSSTGVVNVEGYYLAAALAGLFVGQLDVYVPITQKGVSGIDGIPNQVGINTSTTLQSLGATVVRQRNDGTCYVRHGLTTNLLNWLTQEISINAIGDRLAQNVQKSLENSGVIGSPLTPATLTSVQGTVLTTLLRAVTTNLIQSYENLSVSTDPSDPTTINVRFQYSPTYPLNYVQVTLSLNTQSGTIGNVTNVNTTTV